MKHFSNAVLWSQVLALFLLGLMLYPQTGRYREIIWGIFASIFILVLPGYWISHIFFATDEISSFERFMMSCATSLAVLTFASFYLHYFGIALYSIHIYILSLLIMLVVACVVWFIDRKRLQR